MNYKLNKRGSGTVHHIKINKKVLDSFAKHIFQISKGVQKSDWDISVRELQKTILSNPILRMLYENGQIQSGTNFPLQTFLNYIQTVLITPPQYVHSALIGFPINALSIDFMASVPGFQFFRHQSVNQNFKAILDAYGKFLSSPASALYLNDQQPYGWFCKQAFQKMNLSEYKINIQEKYYGFNSWNDFFIRQFKKDVRPIAQPQNSKIIINSCESTPYKFQLQAKKYDMFWIKSQPYSIYDIFAAIKLSKECLADRFINGTVYQGYLDALSYHRWHAPISGTIQDLYRVQGTYYSQLQSQHFDPVGPNNSQGYLTAASVRFIIVIKADDSALKSVACVYIGMAEVSSCISKVNIGDHVNKGDQLGYFQFGGSTHCLIFEKGVINNLIVDLPNDDSPKLNVNIALALAN